MTLRKTGTCDECKKPLYGDDYGAAGHKCEKLSAEELPDYSLSPFLEAEQTKENTLRAWKAGDSNGYARGKAEEKEKIWKLVCQYLADSSWMTEIDQKNFHKMIFEGVNPKSRQLESNVMQVISGICLRRLRLF